VKRCANTVFTGQRERRGGRKIEEDRNRDVIVIFHERSIKNRHKNFSPLWYTD